jgi:2-oxoisovalerate dehydrogenase E1 component
VVKGWNYPQLVSTYKMAADKTRKTHIPAIIHVEELTQPQGHSTSGSHERYKSADRLQWEKEHDCNIQFKRWILQNKMATEEELTEIEEECQKICGRTKETFLEKIS